MRPNPDYQRTEQLHREQRSEEPATAYDSGEILWQSSRGQDGSERIRLAKKSYQGRDFLDLRIEWRGPNGWLPTKKGCSIRISEIADLRDALDRMLGRLAGARR